MKSNKSVNKEWNKWWLLYPSGKELKRLIQKQRKSKLRALVEWNGGKAYRRRRKHGRMTVR